MNIQAHTPNPYASPLFSGRTARPLPVPSPNIPAFSDTRFGSTRKKSLKSLGLALLAPAILLLSGCLPRQLSVSMPQTTTVSGKEFKTAIEYDTSGTWATTDDIYGARGPVDDEHAHSISNHRWDYVNNLVRIQLNGKERAQVTQDGMIWAVYYQNNNTLAEPVKIPLAQAVKQGSVVAVYNVDPEGNRTDDILATLTLPSVIGPDNEPVDEQEWLMATAAFVGTLLPSSFGPVNCPDPGFLVDKDIANMGLTRERFICAARSDLGEIIGQSLERAEQVSQAKKRN